ncbi:MAG TPA: hypothetical protein ENI69_02060, partial [Rhodospirillales bacterium]|nr:hypothetical protein [Rhodospirillales bacterium]
MFRIFIAIAVLVLVSACAQPAYVYKEGEFDRSSPNYGKELIDMPGVTICYSSRGSTPAQVRALALEECGRFGKSARFVKQDY